MSVKVIASHRWDVFFETRCIVRHLRQQHASLGEESMRRATAACAVLWTRRTQRSAIIQRQLLDDETSSFTISTSPACDGQTDRQTDRRTNRQSL